MSEYEYPHSPRAVNWQNEVQQLLVNDQWEEAISLWAQRATPKVLSLWLLKYLQQTEQHFGTSLLDEMQRWYLEPDEKLRWQIFHQADALGFDTPAGAFALSMFWSHGSMSPEGLEPVYPEPHLSAEMRRCVLLMLSTQNFDSPLEGTRCLLSQWFNQEKG